MSVQRQSNISSTLNWRWTWTDICQPRLFTGWQENSLKGKMFAKGTWLSKVQKKVFYFLNWIQSNKINLSINLTSALSSSSSEPADSGNFVKVCVCSLAGVVDPGVLSSLCGISGCGTGKDLITSAHDLHAEGNDTGKGSLKHVKWELFRTHY